MPTNLDCLLRGCANGHPVRFQGRGAFTGRRLRIAVRPTESALDFDHSLVLASCIEPLLAVAAGLVEPRSSLARAPSYWDSIAALPVTAAPVSGPFPAACDAALRVARRRAPDPGSGASIPGTRKVCQAGGGHRLLTDEKR
jgi:hypothetical protein